MGSNVPCDLDPEGLAGWAATIANPYLPWPVVLDEYVKNRDVWRCSSARIESGALWIRPTTPDWLTWTQDHCGESVCCCGFCQDNYPPGWGGAVTDTAVQGSAASGGSREQEAGSFVCGIGNVEYRDWKTSQFADPSKFVVCMDGMFSNIQRWKPLTTAYPDICRIDRAGTTGCLSDWATVPGRRSAARAPSDGSSTPTCARARRATWEG